MRTMKRVGLGAAVLAGALSIAGATFVLAQDPPARETREGRADGAGRLGGRGGRFGGPGGPGGPGLFGRGGAGGPMGLPLGRLALTEAQRGQVETIRQSHADEFGAIQERMRTARQAVDAAMSADSFDEGLIRTRISELAQVQADLAVIQARVRSELFQQVLTEEQRARAKQLQAERPEGPRGPRGPRQGRSSGSAR